MASISKNLKIPAFVLALIVSFGLALCSLSVNPSEAQAKANKKVAIVYFTNTGTTKAIATKIKKATNGISVQIKATVPYTSKDLDYDNENSRVNKENASAASPSKSSIRPSIRNLTSIKKAIKNAKTVYIGYPIWYGEAPHIMYTLIENVSLKGKIVVPYTTSASSGTGASSKNLKKCAITSSKTKWKAGKSFYGKSTQKQVTKWVSSLK